MRREWVAVERLENEYTAKATVACHQILLTRSFDTAVRCVGATCSHHHMIFGQTSFYHGCPSLSHSYASGLSACVAPEKRQKRLESSSCMTHLRKAASAERMSLPSEPWFDHRLRLATLSFFVALTQPLAHLTTNFGNQLKSMWKLMAAINVNPISKLSMENLEVILLRATDEVTPPLAIGFKTGARSLRWGQDFRSYKAFSLACWPRDLSLTNSTKRYGSFSARYLETRYSISTHRRVWRQYGLCHPVVH